MTTPITQKVSTPVKTEGYAQAEGGIYRVNLDSYVPNIGVALGGKVSKGSTFAKAEAGYGTAFRAKVEVGHEFKLNQNGNLGLELAGNAEYLRDGQKSVFSSEVVINNSEQNGLQTSWNDGYKKAGLSGMFNFKGKKGNVKVGLEGGYSANNAPDVYHTYEINGNNRYQKVHLKKEQNDSGFYMTPKVSAELNLGKNGHWSAIADADMHKGNVGLRYTF